QATLPAPRTTFKPHLSRRKSPEQTGVSTAPTIDTGEVSQKEPTMRIITLIIAVACLIGCADPAFQQYIQNRQAAINAIPNGAAKYIAQERLDQQILADKQRQNQQAANAAAAIALGAAAGL